VKTSILAAVLAKGGILTINPKDISQVSGNSPARGGIASRPVEIFSNYLIFLNGKAGQNSL
jgi:hypothetical protein